MADTKLCNRCKEHKEFECFVKGNCKFGLSNWCRTCNKDFKQTIRKPKEINKNIEGEIWEDVKGYEGLYQISNFGRVFSLEKSTINNGFAAIKFAFFVKINKKRNHLGYFVNELDAKVAYEDALLQHGLTNKYA